MMKTREDAIAAALNFLSDKTYQVTFTIPEILTLTIIGLSMSGQSK